MPESDERYFLVNEDDLGSYGYMEGSSLAEVEKLLRDCEETNLVVIKGRRVRFTITIVEDDDV